MNFTIITFKDNDEIDQYTKSKDYSKKMLCFTIGWNLFDPDSDEFDIELRFSSSVET